MIKRFHCMQSHCKMASVKIATSSKLKFNGDMLDNWNSFAKSFEEYLQASDQSEKSDTKKGILLLNLIGDKGLKLYEELAWSNHEDDKLKASCIMKQFQNHFRYEKSPLYERYRFNTRSKKNGETYAEYVQALRRLASACEFQDAENDLIRDRLIVSISEPNLREQLMQMVNLTLEKALHVCTSVESFEFRYIGEESVKNDEKAAQSTRRRTYSKEMVKNCPKCATDHKVNRCPAYGKQCEKCNKFNHFAAKCRSQNVKELSSSSESESEHSSE